MKLFPERKWPAFVGLTIAIALALGSTTSVSAQWRVGSVFRAGGLLFGDFYHVPSHHLPEGDGAAGAVLRRGYATFDADFSERWAGRLRFELNQAGQFETYTFDVQFKDLYAALKLGQHTLTFGLSPTTTFDLVESIWGLRYLARTPMDLQGIASRDTGVSSKGPLIGNGTLRYRMMIGSGLEFGGESGDGWKWMGAVTWMPSERWLIDLYADHERLVGPVDRTTLQVFLAYTADRIRWGLLNSNQYRQEDPALELASAFVAGDLTSRLSTVARVDRIIEPSPGGDNISYIPFDPSAPATMLLAGVEYRASHPLTLTPNTVVIWYDSDEEGGGPKTDVLLRMTLFLNLE